MVLMFLNVQNKWKLFMFIYIKKIVFFQSRTSRAPWNEFQDNGTRASLAIGRTKVPLVVFTEATRTRPSAP